MPMVRDLLKNSDVSFDDVDLIAAATGPGSFTGIRIGASAAKGLAWASGKPCMGVSTLDAMAHGIMHLKGLICCVMDARRNELYNALFESDGESLRRMCEDRAVSIEKLGEELRDMTKSVVLVGDGAHISFERLKEKCPGLVMAPPHLLHQNAWGVAMAAEAAFNEGKPAGLTSLNPVYIRMSQAERERLEGKYKK